ncbi:MAG: tyrosine-type recombinase/integrase [Campylobacterales bacterium]|nr:tyrosine-type recombinase/integrase [Campylobacterales bacterium]MBN2831844.1 tyrosine-type recombinase/integrase [Campylobacterales bacterium]
MAIDLKEFPNDVDIGLKANKNFTKFFYRFKIEGTTKRGIIDYSLKDWDKRTKVSNAKIELETKRKHGTAIKASFTENSPLNTVADIYFETVCNAKSNWTNERLNAYNLYCRYSIGKKKIKDIKVLDIDRLRKEMETKGHSKQTANGCSPRTIKKVMMQSLKPILQYAIDNKALIDIPKINLPKQHKAKKIVTDAGTKLALLYKTIFALYEDDPFYRALFLFALYGRRWNEIRTLKWTDIKFLENTYTIRAENNKIGINQVYELPIPIAEAVSQLRSQGDLIFESPITQQELFTPKKQLAKIKKIAQMPELTMHYFRHILVSAMGESGVAGTILSASLGHTNLDTVNQFYLSANHTKASVEANKALGIIVSGNRE